MPTDPKPHTEPEVPTGSRSARSSAEPFREFIEAALRKGRNAKAIYQDLVLHRGYDGSYDAVKRLARTLRKREPKVSCRFETEPGQEAQVDYGEGALARDPRTGKYRKTTVVCDDSGQHAPYLTESSPPFPSTLTTKALYLSSLMAV